ncbi:MAG: preprotein translocase subunit SecE [Pseudomonadota bacterium]
MPKSKNRRKPKRSPSENNAMPVASPAEARAGNAPEATSDAPSKPSIGPIQFFRQVRDEFQKVTWTSRNETMISTLMVLVMVAIASVFFFLIDQVLRTIVPMILSISL